MPKGNSIDNISSLVQLGPKPLISLKHKGESNKPFWNNISKFQSMSKHKIHGCIIDKRVNINNNRKGILFSIILLNN